MFSSIKTTTRVSIVIGFIFVGVLWIAVGLNIVPNPRRCILIERKHLCETLAITVSTLASTESGDQLENVLKDSVERNPGLISAGLRAKNGKLMYAVGSHHLWDLDEQANSSDSRQMTVGISANRRHWAELELQFERLSAYGNWAESRYPIPILLFCGCAAILLVRLYLSRILQHLNPSKVVPKRVRSAFDSLAEGLIMTDPSHRIVLANQAFCKLVGCDEDEPQGRDPASFGWTLGEDSDESDEDAEIVMPWEATFEQATEIRGQILRFTCPDGRKRKFIINSTPVLGENGKCRGVLTSFDDITALENKQDQLVKTLHVLQNSRDEIKRQNKELQVLASVDPLSGCLNRRSFFEKFEGLWNRGDSLSTIMVDIDYFKKINDKHGHAIGDAFIRETGKLLRDAVGDSGLTCRYGGEEFCVLLLNSDTERATELAWKINRNISATLVKEIPFTASLGVSSRELKAKDPDQMLDQADKCLYVAKRQGRDQVVRWDTVTEEDLVQTDAEVRGAMTRSTVDALIAALAYRDRGTAEHCRRVANLCIEVAADILEPEEIQELEYAALLHDIGKVGVPDSILLKAGSLNENEWKIMEKHDDMSYDIVKAAIASETICSIVYVHHYHYENIGNEERDKMPWLGASIVSVCDAYDAMTNDRVYRKAMTQQEAFVELRTNGKSQFDPTVVELVIETISRDPDCINRVTLDEILSVDGKQVESRVLRLQAAISEKDVEELPSLLHQLITVMSASDISPNLDEATAQLQSALDENDAELEKLLGLTNEVLALARSSQADKIADDLQNSEELPEILRIQLEANPL